MTTIDQPAFVKMTKARTGLLIDQPFFGSLAMRLKLIEEPGIKTLNVDGSIVRYNPTFINSLTSDLAKSALAHEVMHCVLEHCGASGRGINLDPKKWNYAADYAVNDILKKSGFVLGDGWLWDAQYSGMSAEHIYKLIPTPPPDNGGGPGTGSPQDEVLPGSSDPSTQAQQAADWKLATAQAAQAAKAVGKLSQPLEQFVDKLQKNKVDWKAELRHFLVQAAKNDYAWQRPNRKMLAAGFVLPGLYSESMGQLVIASDESGSVDKAITAAFAAEINAIKEDLRPEKITLQHFDTQVVKVEEFGPDDEFEMKRFAYGGTCFREPIRVASEMEQAPMCMIILTDLYGPFPDTAPEFPVLWVCINELKAPFGTTLHIEV
jgi:predicted metal-dependent peptidase